MSLSATPPQHAAHDWIPGTLHLILWLVGAAAGIAAAVYTHDQRSSFWLALFAFVVVSNPIARAADLAKGPRKLMRAGLILVFPLVAVAILAVVWALGSLWLGVVLGLVGGLVAQSALSRALSLRIVPPKEPLGPPEDHRWIRPGPSDIETRMR
jgi:hypothetical protein